MSQLNSEELAISGAKQGSASNLSVKDHCPVNMDAARIINEKLYILTHKHYLDCSVETIRECLKLSAENNSKQKSEILFREEITWERILLLCEYTGLSISYFLDFDHYFAKIRSFVGVKNSRIKTHDPIYECIFFKVPKFFLIHRLFIIDLSKFITVSDAVLIKSKLDVCKSYYRNIPHVGNTIGLFYIAEIEQPDEEGIYLYFDDNNQFEIEMQYDKHGVMIKKKIPVPNSTELNAKWKTKCAAHLISFSSSAHSRQEVMMLR